MKRILIIEDDFFVASIYEETFKEAGHEVAIAYDGETGLRRVGEFKPDLVQLDLMVPKMNGPGVIRELRANPAWKSLPVLVISSCSDFALVREAKAAGASEVIAKRDCSPRIVLERVEALLLPPARQTAAPAPAAPAPQPPVPSPAAYPPAEPVISGKPPDLRRKFLERSSQVFADLRARLHTLIKSSDPALQAAGLEDLYLLVHALAGQARITGCVRIAHLTDALELLLRDLYERPKRITSSTLNTIARAVDCLPTLFQEARLPAQEEAAGSTLILAVDDEPLALETLGAALAKANLKALCLHDPQQAVRLLASNRFDLIFLDAEMPGLDGFEVCKRLRAFPTNRKTPVVYVTALSDFEARARAALSGGNDLIAKPFPLSEVAVKALTFLAPARADRSDGLSPAAAPERQTAPLAANLAA